MSSSISLTSFSPARLPPTSPKKAWEEAVEPTRLAAPNGGAIQARLQSVAPSRMEGYWDRVTELTQKIKGLETQLQEARDEARNHHQACAESEVQRKYLQAELEEARAQRAYLSQELAKAQEAAHNVELRIKSETAKVAAELAEIKARPVPPNPAEVQTEIFRVFRKAAMSLCHEVALAAGVDSETADGIASGVEDLPMAMANEEGMELESRADAFLRAVMEQAVRAVEPARIEALQKWRGELKRRRILQDQLQELKGSIRVMCRIRPTTPDEGEAVVTLPTPTDVVVNQPGRDGRRSFAFDHAFGPSSNQADVFEEVEPVVESVLEGFNVCIFAYGQTGSGKTFTMGGVSNDEELAGINPRALRHLFNLVAERRQLASMGSSNEDEAWNYEVSLSYLEIYNENLRDLLAPKDNGKDVARNGAKKKGALEVRSLPNEPVSVPGLTSVSVRSAHEVEDALERGGLRRSVAATKCNAQSSRSHSICIVSVIGKHQRTGATTHGKLHLVDLAGSERVKKSDVSGQAMLEAQAINKSLSALGNVMAKLQEKAKHIPFRDSKLTQLLADSLGGNSKTFMFVNINPCAEAASESLCSLEFAMRVRKVELGKASGRRVDGATLPELKAAKAAEERAQVELKAALTKVADLEIAHREVVEAHKATETELYRERESLRSYQETETFLKEQGEERQRLELSEERKRSAHAERQVKEIAARLQAAEEEIRQLRAGRGSAGTSDAINAAAQAPPRPVTQAEALEAIAALRQHAADSLGDFQLGNQPRAPLLTSANKFGLVNEVPSPLLRCQPPGLSSASEAPLHESKSSTVIPDMIHLDAAVLCNAPLLQPLASSVLAADPLPTLTEEPTSSPQASCMHHSPKVSKPAGTPSQRYTPSHLVRGNDAIRSSRKVKFDFRCGDTDGSDAGMLSDMEAPPFPAFCLGDAKEDRISNVSSSMSGLSSASKADMNKRPRPNFKFEPLATSSLGSASLGRAFAGGASRRPLAPRPIGVASGPISKGTAASRRRSSIAAHVQRASSRRASLASSICETRHRHTSDWK